MGFWGFGVKIGFESGNQYVVDNIVNKHLDLKEAAEVVKYLKQDRKTSCRERVSSPV